MYAIIESGGRQYRVEKGTFINIDEPDKKPGDTIEFKNVLMLVDNGEVNVGTPYLKDTRILGEIMGEVKSRKVIVFKKKKRKDYKKKIGHKQKYTQVRIKEIAGSVSRTRDT